MSSFLLPAIDAIYQSASEPTHWPTALQLVSDCLGDVGAILIYGKDDGSFGVIHSPSLDPLIDEYGRDWSFEDIRAVRSRERGYFFNRDVITDRDVVTEAELDCHPFYAEYLRKHGLKYFAAAMVSPGPRIEVALSIQRATGRPVYSEAELELVAQFGQHVERSLRLGIRMMGSDLVKDGLSLALARLGNGVFVLDSLGRVIFKNTKAESLLGDGLEMVEDRLAVSALASNVPASSALKRISDLRPETKMDRERPIIVHREGSARPLALYALPIPVGATKAHQMLSQGRMILLAVDPQHDNQLDPSLVRDVLGLTLGEARLTALVGTGQSPREAANQLGITEESARTVLKRVFAKTGMSRQGELAAMLARLLLN